MTIRHHLHHINLFERVARKKPLLSINNKLKGLQFAKCYWDFQWDQVIWSNETKIELFGHKPQRWVWRIQHLTPTVKYGGGSLMLLGCFSSKALDILLGYMVSWTPSNTSRY